MTDTKTPAAQKSGRAQSKATANAAKVEGMNAAAAEPNRTELIKTATGLGIKGASAKNKLELKRAIEAAKAQAIVRAVVESAKTGPNAEATKAASAKAPTAAEKLAASPQTSMPAKSGQITRRTTRGERGLKAKAQAQKLGKRGPGRKVSDEELIAYVAKVRSEHPETNASDELEYAYWIEKLAVNRDRFNRAWTEAAKAA